MLKCSKLLVVRENLRQHAIKNPLNNSTVAGSQGFVQAQRLLEETAAGLHKCKQAGVQDHNYLVSCKFSIYCSYLSIMQKYTE